ncbi:hypothetical protein M8J76_008924 [Diaphorina citri]|nr:hypothetical protein M8J75_003045 [Diaphorina citri]KAI5745173.1 hypothetical protein M8J76_008924 [Diaphorina citri]
MALQPVKISKQHHHVQQELCTTRASYRQGRKLTAVKVYTVNDESNHLLIYGVPSIGLLEEVTKQCRRYGDIKPVQYVDYPDRDEFTDVFHVTYKRIQAARFAKRQIDTKNFFGNILHVFYAPELETLAETRNKLTTRRKEVSQRIKKLREGTDEVPCKRNEKEQSGKNVVEKDYLSLSMLEPTSISQPSCGSQEPYTLDMSHHNNSVTAVPSLYSRSINIDQPEQSFSQSGNRKPCAYTSTNASHNVSVANFYKVYNASATNESTEPAIPKEIVTSETQLNLNKIINANPYKVDAPFVEENYLLKSPQNENSNRLPPTKRKYPCNSEGQPNKINYVKVDMRNVTNQSSLGRQVLNRDSSSFVSDNAKVQNRNDRLKTLSTTDAPSCSRSSGTKFQFIPRQIIPQKNQSCNNK